MHWVQCWSTTMLSAIESLLTTHSDMNSHNTIRVEDIECSIFDWNSITFIADIRQTFLSKGRQRAK